MIRKLMICPWFGPLPAWWDRYEQQLARLALVGYHFLLDFNPDRFKQRAHDRLGVTAPIVEGGGKIHDYRATFGILYEHELAGFDFWGHTDFDCVYGRVEHFWPDTLLADLDVLTDHTYVLGPWTLYRNVPAVNELFYAHPDWRDYLEGERVNGWVETEFTDLLLGSGLRVRAREAEHVYEVADLRRLTMDGERLLCGGREVPLGHFRRTKEWPAGVA